MKSVHPEVYCQQIFATRQSDGETITLFVSRLKSQVMLCAFERQCGCDNQHCTTSFSEDMIKYQIITSLWDTSHQSKILMEINCLPTLNDLVRCLLTLESTARATNHLQLTEAPQITPIKSASSQKFPPHNKNKTNNDKCKGCSCKTHPKGHRQCPAWGKSCHNVEQKTTSHMYAVA